MGDGRGLLLLFFLTSVRGAEHFFPAEQSPHTMHSEHTSRVGVLSIRLASSGLSFLCSLCSATCAMQPMHLKPLALLNCKTTLWLPIFLTLHQRSASMPLSLPKVKGDQNSSQQSGGGGPKSKMRGGGGGAASPASGPSLSKKARKAAAAENTENKEQESPTDVEMGGGAAASGTRNKGGSSSKKVAQVQVTDLSLLLKSVLRCLQDNRTHAGVLFDVVIVEATSSMAKGMIEQGQSYSQLRQQEGGDQLGPPHVYVFGGLLEALVSEGEKIGAANLKEIQNFATEFGDLTSTEKAELVLHTRCEKMYNSEFRRLVMCFERVPIRKNILDAMVQLGGRRKQGRAPKGAMERALESWLEKLLDVK